MLVPEMVRPEGPALWQRDDPRIRHAFLVIVNPERLRPLAAFLGARRYIRLPGKPGAVVRHVDPALLQRALGRLLHSQPLEAAVLIAVAVEGSTAGWDLDPADLLRLATAALHELARLYEDLLWTALSEPLVPSVPPPCRHRPRPLPTS